MIPFFFIDKIKRKISIEHNLAKLRAISNSLAIRTPQSVEIQIEEEVGYYYYIQLGSGAGPDSDKEIYNDEKSIENILDFWFNFQPDPHYEKADPVLKNSEDYDMQAKKREFPYTGRWGFSLEYENEDDEDAEPLGVVIWLDERLQTPQEHWIQGGKEYQYILSEKDEDSWAHKKGTQSYNTNHCHRLWGKIIYLGTDDTYLEKLKKVVG